MIEAAIAAFWAKGFAATTLADLEAATGVDRSTIYNSFGGKDGLYRSATTRYLDLADQRLFESLHQGEAGLADIQTFLDRLSTMLSTGASPGGCLVVNNMAADTDDEAADRYLQQLETGLRSALDRAASAGETAAEATQRRSRSLTAAVLGVNIVHRGGGGQHTALALLDGLRQEVASWAADSTPRAGS